MEERLEKHGSRPSKTRDAHTELTLRMT